MFSRPPATRTHPTLSLDLCPSLKGSQRFLKQSNKKTATKSSACRFFDLTTPEDRRCRCSLRRFSCDLLVVNSPIIDPGALESSLTIYLFPLTPLVPSTSIPASVVLFFLGLVSLFFLSPVLLSALSELLVFVWRVKRSSFHSL